MYSSIMTLLLLCFLSSPLSAGKDQPKPKGNSSICIRDAVDQARRFFHFHYGSPHESDSGPDMSPPKEIAPIKSPDGKRKYKVFEVFAEIGKMGTYRIRLIYAELGTKDPKNDCLLMGQEILSMSSI